MFKVALCADLVTTAAFIADYSRLTRGRWRKNPIGRAMVLIDVLLALAILPSVLSLFVHFNRLTSVAAAWFDVAVFAAIALAMAHRILVFERFHRREPPQDDDGKGKPGGG